MIFISFLHIQRACWGFSFMPLGPVPILGSGRIIHPPRCDSQASPRRTLYRWMAERRRRSSERRSRWNVLLINHNSAVCFSFGASASGKIKKNFVSRCQEKKRRRRNEMSTRERKRKESFFCFSFVRSFFVLSKNWARAWERKRGLGRVIFTLDDLAVKHK